MINKIITTPALFTIAILVTSSSFALEPSRWECLVSAEDLFDVSLNELDVRVNNISVTETDNFITGEGVTLSASVANRSNKNKKVSIETVGLKKNTPVFAISAKLPFGMIAAGKSDTISHSIPREPGILSEIDSFCIRIDVND